MENIKEQLLKLGYMVKETADVKSADDWRLVYLGIVGAWHALSESKNLLINNRDIPSMLDGAEELLSCKDKTDKYYSWALGYHLNNAEMRVSFSLERLMKTFINGDGIKAMANKILESFRPLLDDRAKTILEELIVGEGNNSKLCLVRERVNSIKHDRKPDHDSNDPNIRYEDTKEALGDLIHLYSVFLKIRNI